MKLLIVGARADGQAHMVIEVIQSDDTHQAVAFADETPELKGQQVLGRPVLGDPAEIAEQVAELGITGAFVAVGVPQARARLAEVCRSLGLSLPTLIHPSAYLSPEAQIGEGVFLGAGVQVLPGASVGDLCLVNAGTIVSHHVQVGRCNSIGPNATLSGRSRTEPFVFLGAGCTVLPEVRVGQGTTVGAGAVVTRDVAADLTVVGVPAKPLQRDSRQ